MQPFPRIYILCTMFILFIFIAESKNTSRGMDSYLHIVLQILGSLIIHLHNLNSCSCKWSLAHFLCCSPLPSAVTAGSCADGESVVSLCALILGCLILSALVFKHSYSNFAWMFGARASHSTAVRQKLFEMRANSFEYSPT